MSDIDPQIMREFNEALKSFNETMGRGGSNGDSTDKFSKAADKIVVALGMLVAKGAANSRKEKQQIDDFIKKVDKATTKVEQNSDATEKNTDTIKKNSEELAEEKRLRKQVNKLTEEQQKEYVKLTKEIKEQTTLAKQQTIYERTKHDAGIREIKDKREHQSATRSMVEELSSLGAPSSMLKDAFFGVFGVSMKSQVGLMGLTAVAEGLTKSLSQYNSAIYNGERGAKVSAKAFTELVKPLSAFGKVVGGLLMAVGALTSWIAGVGVPIAAAGAALYGLSAAAETAAEFNEIAADQTDKLFKSFNDLSRAGISFKGGMTDVFNTLQTLGMTRTQIEDFTKILAGNTKTLKMFGGSAADGAKLFASVAGGLEKSGMGRQLEMLGVTAEEQREVALEYMSIQARTGQLQLQTADKLKKSAFEFTKELDAAAELTGTTRKEQMEARELAMADEKFRGRLIEARQNGDEKEIKRLEMIQALSANVAKYDKEGAQGILHYGASGATDAASIAAMNQYGLDKMDLSGRTSATQLTLQAAQGVEQNQRTFAGLNAYTGKLAGQQTNIAGTDDFKIAVKAAAEAAAKAGYTGAGSKGTLEDYLATEQGKKMLAPDKQIKDMVDATRQQQNTQMLQDSFVSTFNKAAELNDIASKNFNEAVNRFSNAVGAKPIEGGQAVTGGAGAVTVTPAESSRPVITETGGGAALFTRSLRRRTATVDSANEKAPGDTANENANNRKIEDLINFNGGIAGHRRNFDGLNDELKSRVLAAAAEYNTATGKKFLMTSGARSEEDQEKIRQSRPGLAAKGRSRHQDGAAIDIPALDGIVVAALKAQGLKQVVNGEDWHWEKMMNGGILRAVPGGQMIRDNVIAAEAGKNEAYVPLPDGRNIPVTVKGDKNSDRMVNILENMSEKYDTIIALLDDANGHHKKVAQSVA
jgi:hypothetical protein